MRFHRSALALPLFALAACGGAGPETVGSIAPPAPSGSAGSGGTATGGGTGSNGGTGAPVGTGSTTGSGTGGTTGGSGTSVGPATGTTPTTPTTFLSVNAETTFNAVGALHSFGYDEKVPGFDKQPVLYQGNASTTRTPSGTISYSPRDGIFTVSFNDKNAGVENTVRFQDPAHRSDFNPENTPTLEAPNLAGFNYLESTDKTQRSTFFYQRPDATTYVTLAGFTRQDYNDTGLLARKHGVMVFGSLTPQTQIPINGSGTYTGGFIASAVLDTARDSRNPQPAYMQWITGASNVSVDFGKSTVALSFDGTVGPTFQNGQLISNGALLSPSGTRFQASGTAQIDLLRTGGFAGAFTNATLGGKAIDFSPISAGSSTSGASSIDGTFFGPNAVNVGGNFRIVGGVPDQRVDIQGAFTGAKK
jgi:hypothetical protein